MFYPTYRIRLLLFMGGLLTGESNHFLEKVQSVFSDRKQCDRCFFPPVFKSDLSTGVLVVPMW